MSLTVHQFCRKPYLGAYSLERVFADINAALPAEIDVVQIANRFYSRGLLSRLHDSVRASLRAGAVNHVLGDVHYLTFLLPRGRTILTIHDCEMIERAQGIKKRLLKLLWLDIPLRRSKWIVAISERTRQDIVRLSGSGLTKIVVIPNPVSASFKPSPLPDPDELGRYIVLHIGTKPNKNLDRLIDAANGLPLKLMVIGRLTDPQRVRLERSGLAYELRHDLSADEIVDAYRQATILSFVSLSEGFGLPIIEAQASGRAVLCADRDPMRSVAGEGALFVDPESTTAIHMGLKRLLSDADLRAQLVEAGQQNVSRFAAETIAESYAALYREVAQQ